MSWLFYWRRLPSLKPAAPLVSVVIGVVAVVIWIGLDPYLVHYDQPLIGRNPFLLYPAGEAWVLFGFRVAGIAICVPILEELFWRGFLMRWLIKEDFTSVPLGTYQHVSFWVTTAFFASVHGAEWPLAVVVGVIYGGWFVRTKSLGSIMLAHGGDESAAGALLPEDERLAFSLDCFPAHADPPLSRSRAERGKSPRKAEASLVILLRIG